MINRQAQLIGHSATNDCHGNCEFSLIYFNVIFFRKIAAEEIQRAWKRRQICLRNNPNPSVRKFEFFPKLFDSEATDYSKMIPIEKLTARQKTVPPLILGLIKDMGIDKVVKLIIEGNLPILEIACHSQGQFHT